MDVSASARGRCPVILTSTSWADHWIIPEEGRDVYDPANYSVAANLRGEPVFYLHLKQRRAESAVFTYNLTPAGLREAVAVLRDAGNGIEQWITPGLAHMQADLAEMKADPNRDALKATITELLRSVRDIPIATRWEPLRRGWECWQREHASTAAEEDTLAMKPRRNQRSTGKVTPRKIALKKEPGQ